MKNIKKKILQKFIVAIVVVIIFFNLISPSIVQADVGGVLFWPVQQLVELLGDSILWVMQSVFIGVNDSITTKYNNMAQMYSWEKPNVQISPELIFLNKISAFDINFFNPKVYKNLGRESFDLRSFYNFSIGLREGLINYEGQDGEAIRGLAIDVVREIQMHDNPGDVEEIGAYQYITHDDYDYAVLHGSTDKFAEIYHKVKDHFPAIMYAEIDVTGTIEPFSKGDYSWLDESAIELARIIYPYCRKKINENDTESYYFSLRRFYIFNRKWTIFT